MWLSPETRTVVLLTLVIYFRYMHLRDLPYDNRAYMGVDRLQFQSLATFTWLLLGRLFRTMLELTDNALAKDWSPAFYLPAMLNFFFLVGRAIYLILREVIWPLQSPPTLMPKCVRDRLDHRVTFSFIPPAVFDVDAKQQHFHRVEHGSLSADNMADLAEDWNLTSTPALPNQEREILKTILTETAEVLLRRHEIVHGEANLPVTDGACPCGCDVLCGEVSNHQRRIGVEPRHLGQMVVWNLGRHERLPETGRHWTGRD